VILTSRKFASAKPTIGCAWISANRGHHSSTCNLKVANKIMKENYKRELQTSSKREK
jgi:hypothetical protein